MGCLRLWGHLRFVRSARAGNGLIPDASWAMAAELVPRSFRNWYQAHYPYVFAKFRCVSID